MAQEPDSPLPWRWESGEIVSDLPTGGRDVVIAADTDRCYEDTCAGICCWLDITPGNREYLLRAVNEYAGLRARVALLESLLAKDVTP